VRVALIPSVARMLLPGLLARLADEPGVEPQCRDVLDVTPGRLPALTADFDVVVSHRDETAPPPATDRWLVVPLLREPLDVVLPPGHPLAGRPRLRLDELTGEPWISVEAGSAVDDVLRTLAVRTGHTPQVVQRINDLSVTAALVAAGHGVALLPRYSTDDRLGLVRRPLAGVRAARLVEAVLRTSTAQRPAVATVLAALQAEAEAVAAR
jgi:DNA-binding transcriptional LysR family regulator